MKPHILILTTALIFVSGCLNGVKPNSGTAEQVTAILKDVQSSFGEIKASQQALIDAQNNKQKKTQESMQYAADRVFTAQYVNLQNPAQSPYTGLVDTNLLLSLNVLPSPSLEVRAQSILDLQHALSKLQKDREDLAKRYDELKKESDTLNVEKVRLDSVVMQKQGELEKATASATGAVAKLADAEASAKIKAAEAEEAGKKAREEAASKSRLKVAVTFMSVGGILIVAAIVATVVHVAGVLLPGIVSGLSLLVIGWLITYVEQLIDQTWFRYTVGGILILGVVFLGFVLYRSKKQREKAALDSVISTNAIGALQDAKNDDAKTGTKTFESMVPYLNEWHQTSSGAADTTVQNEIDKRLVAMNLKAAKPQT